MGKGQSILVCGKRTYAKNKIKLHAHLIPYITSKLEWSIDLIDLNIEAKSISFPEENTEENCGFRLGQHFSDNIQKS